MYLHICHTMCEAVILTKGSHLTDFHSNLPLLHVHTVTNGWRSATTEYNITFHH